MIDYIFENKAKLIIGNDSIKNLENELLKLNVKKMLILYSGNYIQELNIYDEIMKICKKNNILCFENGNIISNPQIDLVRKLINDVKNNEIDFILAVGGGSVIDTAKAVSVGAKTNIDIWKYFIEQVEILDTLNIGVISTISSSGSEMSNCAILSNENRKLGIEDNKIIPNFVIVDPKYTANLPWNITSYGIVDISTHLLERYFSLEKNTLVTDYLLQGALKSLIEISYKLKERPKDLELRKELAFLSIIAHNNSLEIGRIPDWASHRIEHELSAIYNINHGVGMGIIFPSYIRYISNKINDDKLISLAKNVFGIENGNDIILELADKLEEFYKKMEVPTRLSNLGIDSKEFETIGKLATKNDEFKIGHYYKLNSKDIVEVLKMAM